MRSQLRLPGAIAIIVLTAIAAPGLALSAAGHDTSGSARVTLDTPHLRATLAQPRPRFAGHTSLPRSHRRPVRIKVWQGRHALGRPDRVLRAHRRGHRFWARPKRPLRPGIYTARARQRDMAGRITRSKRSMFKVSRRVGNGRSDTTPPDTTITDGPSGTIASASASFSFTSSETGSSFQCALDSSGWSPCSSPKAYSSLADGAHTFAVKATDAAGNTDATPATRSFTVDTTPPDTAITSGPSGTVEPGSQTFSFTSSEPGSSFQCRFDGWANWQSCSSPATYANLAAGTRTFSVRAIDAAGNADLTPATLSFTIASSSDTTPPDTTITDGPSGTIASASASFSFTSSETGSSFQCALDSSGWSPCSSPKAYSSLADGAHTFAVKATDAAGNTDATPATRSFTVSTSSGGSTGGPPSGTIVQADNLTQACPIDHLWGAVSDAYYYTQSCSSWSDADDPQVNYSASGGPSFALPGNQVRPGFRRLSLTAGMQSLYDAGVPNSSYRAQLVSNSNTRTYYPMQPGHRYVWWITVRFQDPTQLPGDKVTQDSQIAQIKNTGTCTTSSTEGPIESLSETQNNVLLKERQADGDVRIDSFPIVQRGVWQVFALDVMYTNDRSQAAYQLWADQDGDSTLNMTPLTPKITGRVTAVGPDCVGKPSIGPYEPMSLPPVSRDYGVNQMVEVPVGAPWG